MAIAWPGTRIQSPLDFERGGRQIGDLRLRHSDVDVPLGYWPIPAAVLAGAPGPTLLLTAGVHGDEFDGPAALMRLVHALELSTLRGRLIVLPALNGPAVACSRRTSPLDDGNLNRAFPGDPNGGPTQQIAHFVEQVLLPCCDAAIDLHSGGKASVFVNCSLATRTADKALFGRNLELARAFGAPFIWVLGKHNDDRSLNAAAARQGIPMIAAELGGAGVIDPNAARLAHDGILRCMRHLGMLEDAPVGESTARMIEIASATDTLYASCEGLFVRRFEPGDVIEAGAAAGILYPLFEPERPPVTVTSSAGGVVLSRTNRGLVRRGDMLAMIAAECVDAV
jgi:predicted deacylase